MASTRPRTCGECAYLERTSPEQVFLRCKFWCGNHHSVHGTAYVETHCHMQPSATACDWWLRRGDWREQVKKEKLERKLRKKAVKLARFAKRHGFDYLGIGAYVRVMPAAYVNCDRDGQLDIITVPLEGGHDA